jgi:putative NADH-flavin reductase
VRLVVGDAREAAAVAETVKGADAVFSTLGPSSPFKKSDLLERAVPAIVGAMDAAGVKRLIVLGGGGWQPGALQKQSAVRRAVFSLVGKTLLKKPFEWHRTQDRVVRASDLDWTIVAPPILVNAKAKGKYRVDGDALPKGATQIARADLAEFMFFELEDREWVRKVVYVAW